MDGTANGLLESVTQKVLHAQNFSRSSSQASHVLTDLLSRYVFLLASTCTRYAEHAGRASVSVGDALYALEELGLSVDELTDYAQGEGRDVARYAGCTTRRAEELALLKDSLAEGRRVDRDDAITLVYAEVMEPMLNGATVGDGEEEESDEDVSEDEEARPRMKVETDISMNGDESEGRREDAWALSHTLPPSPISNPASPSPSRKRARLASWNPPSHIPDFLPPYPVATTTEATLPRSPSPQIKAEHEMMPPPPSSAIERERERERLPTPLPQQLSTATSAADYLTPVPYSMSSLSSTPSSHLPDRQAYTTKPPAGTSTALQLQPRKHTMPEITPALLGAYHHMLTNPPSAHPSTNPTRHRVALAMLGQAYASSRWTPADTLFGSAAAPKPRVVAPGPTYPVPIGGKGKDEQQLFVPSSTSRPIVPNESVVLPSYQSRSRIPDIAKGTLPVPVFNRASRVNPPPALVNNTTKEKLLYGTGVPAPWNSNLLAQATGTMTLKGKNKDKGGKGLDGDDEEEKERKRKDDTNATNAIPDALLLATWDWEAHDFRQPPSVHKRARTLGNFALNAIGSNGSVSGNGVVVSVAAGDVGMHPTPGPPVRKNSIKIGKGK